MASTFRSELFADGDTCAICLDPLDTCAVTILHPCRHFLHLDCMLAGRLIKCPLCNAVLTVKAETGSNANSNSDSSLISRSALSTATRTFQRSIVDTAADSAITVRRFIDLIGNRFWKNEDDLLHRDDDLPAIKWACGSKWWYKNGQLHRDLNDQPAIEQYDGYGDEQHKKWYVNGKRHRGNDQPAYEGADGSKEWWVDGKRHRDGGLPAIEWANGTKKWWVGGQLHRDDDLPAIEWANGKKEWWTNGRFVRSG